MKQLTLVCVLMGALISSTVFAADPFEGKISLNITTAKGRTQKLDLAMKGKLQRMDMAMGEKTMGSILDLEKRQVTVMMPEQQMYMVMPMRDAAAAAKQEATEAKLEKTGQTEKILGYLCQLCTVKVNGKTTEMWLAEGLGSFIGMGGAASPMGGRPPPQSTWEKALAGVEGFPLRVVEKDAAGKEVFRMEATRVEKAAQPDALFAPPAEYRLFDMGAMMQGMPGGKNPFNRGN
ncbi:MAG: DUF4412 domain-containing protein [Opitutae bacterium]|nr:DUF4412 domain-containing protein [Opitutae bacterium]